MTTLKLSDGTNFRGSLKELGLLYQQQQKEQQQQQQSSTTDTKIRELENEIRPLVQQELQQRQQALQRMQQLNIDLFAVLEPPPTFPTFSKLTVAPAVGGVAERSAISESHLSSSSSSSTSSTLSPIESATNLGKRKEREPNSNNETLADEIDVK